MDGRKTVPDQAALLPQHGGSSPGDHPLLTGHTPLGHTPLGQLLRGYALPSTSLQRTPDHWCLLEFGPVVTVFIGSRGVFRKAARMFDGLVKTIQPQHYECGGVFFYNVQMDVVMIKFAM